MKILTKKHIEQINWSELTELIVITGFNRRGIGKLNKPFGIVPFAGLVMKMAN